MPTLEFFYDVGSPWTYLAFHKVEQVAADAGAELVWKPILVGGVFNAVNPAVYESRANPIEPRMAYMGKDLADWARSYGLKIVWPPAVFPVNSVKAMRGCFVAMEQDRIAEYARAVFECYWRDLEDISLNEVLEKIISRREVGLDIGKFFDKIARPETRQKLRDNTDELIARGGFGSPTLFVNTDDMFFGNDRLVLVREALAR